MSDFKVIVNKKQLSKVDREEIAELTVSIEKLYGRIDLLKRRLFYLNILKNPGATLWNNEEELVNVAIDTDEEKVWSGDDFEPYIGRGYDSNGRPVYFKKSELVKILKYNKVEQ